MHLIVGIDPGKTAAIACVDLDGRIVYLSHKAEVGVDWLTSSIAAVGIPSIIAADKQKGTYAIRKISAYFNARVFYPDRDIGVEEKREIARAARIKDSHERDACAAALKAYGHFRNKLDQAAHIARERGAMDIDRIKAKVLDRYSIDEAISDRKANRK
jgi:predicted RNase H-like nuclease (RuvC/YqgF family)